jgi:hypothetical protein
VKRKDKPADERIFGASVAMLTFWAFIALVIVLMLVVYFYASGK